MKRTGAVLLCIMLTFLCACSSRGRAETSQVESEPDPQLSSSPQIAATPTADVMETLIFYKDICVFEEQLEDGRLCRVEYPVLYPDAQQAKRYGLTELIQTLNASLAEQAREEFVRLRNSAAADSELNVENAAAYFSRTDVLLPRADSRALSMLFRTESCAGQTQVTLSYGCKNYDVAGRKELTLFSVASDSKALTAAVRERLLGKYPKTAFFDPTLAMDEYIMDLNKYVWTMDYQGLSFYFAPYDLAPYEEGSQLVGVSFAEHSQLFGLYYDRRPYTYAIPLVEGECLNYDLDLDGKSDEIRLKTKEEQGRITALKLTANGRTFDVKTAIRDLESYLVYTGPDRNYLLVNAYNETAFGYIAIYRLERSGISLAGMLYDTSLQAAGLTPECAGIPLITDPGHLQLGSLIPLLGTQTGVKTYAIGSSGVPESSEEYYRLYAQTSLTVKTGFSTTEIDPGTGQGLNRAIRLEPGTQLHFLRSDGRSFVDMMTTDGYCCRLYVSGKGEGQTVNGIPLTQCFDGVK